jgi:hypothetical protein
LYYFGLLLFFCSKATEKNTGSIPPPYFLSQFQPVVLDFVLSYVSQDPTIFGLVYVMIVDASCRVNYDTLAGVVEQKRSQITIKNSGVC